jgi:hypothetical protein
MWITRPWLQKDHVDLTSTGIAQLKGIPMAIGA